MKKFYKILTLVALLISFTLIITACTSGRTTTIQYDLSLQVAGEGHIRDSVGRTLISSENTTILDRRVLRADRRSTVRLNAIADEDNNEDFLFWAGDITNFSQANNSIYVDSNKDLIAVFGGDEIFMTGYITESNQTTNVTGYWKTTTDPGTEINPNLEIYLNQRKANNETYRYINNNDIEEGKVRAIRDGTGSKFIASIEKLEKSDDLVFGTEATRLLFVYADFDGLRALVIPDDHPDIYDFIEDEFERIEGISEDEEFITAVRDMIQRYKEEDVIRGQTFILPAN